MLSGIVGFFTTFIEIAKRRCMSAYNAYFFLAMRLLSYISSDLPLSQETSKSYLTPQWTMLIIDLLNPKSPDNPGNLSFNITR